MGRKIITDEIGKEIIKMYNDGMNINKIRLHFNNSPNYDAVKNFLQNQGLIEIKTKYLGYSYDECMEIGELYVNNEYDELYKKYPKLNKQKIYTICSHFNIKKESYYWDPEDEELLRKYYGKISLDELNNMLHRKCNINAIRTKALKMGLGSNPFWTQEENNILLNNYSFVPKEEIIKMLPKRTYDAIMDHAKLLGVKSYEYLNQKYSPEQKQFIIDNWMCMTDQEIADHIGKTARGVMEQRNDMNLYRIRRDYSNYPNLLKLFRGHIQDWKIATMELCGYKCIITGSKDFDIHHIIGFNTIADEAFKIISQEIEINSDNPEDYDVATLNRMIKIFKETHSKYPLGVCVKKDIHYLFHKEYGSGGNTQEQWDMFLQKIKDGKYDII